ncbi:MepB family protein [Chitinophaga horti]|uniref:MepB family protein n=1 Tax=Chitinophaga horti TaxID=2920382 RepID=A0ABY6J7Y2_9BACT|nr:MepB family protein [Chitinophaga horti]UYQ94412.1 MepB family protein [Chitinophaga horti]
MSDHSHLEVIDQHKPAQEKHLSDALQRAIKSAYDPSGWRVEEVSLHTESQDYAACSFTLNCQHVQYREAKITPTKAGQFVTTWKRDENGITIPFDSKDAIDFFIIAVRKDDHFGQFIFPKKILAEKGIITHEDSEGKRGFRVYPPWDAAPNRQAVKSQEWQVLYFVKMDGDVDLRRLALLLTH